MRGCIILELCISMEWSLYPSSYRMRPSSDGEFLGMLIAILPPLTWAQFDTLFLEKYMPRTLRDHKKDEFMALE